MQRRIARVLNTAGIAAPVLWLVALVYIGGLRPEYSHYRQYVSELAARGTPTQHLMQVAGFAGAALLIVSGVFRVVAIPLVFCAGCHVACRAPRMGRRSL